MKERHLRILFSFFPSSLRDNVAKYFTGKCKLIFTHSCLIIFTSSGDGGGGRGGEEEEEEEQEEEESE